MYLRFYRDCAGITMPNTQIVYFSNPGCPGFNIPAPFTLTRYSRTDITPMCPGSPSNCNGGGGYGLEEIRYARQITLPQGCGTNWILSYSLCCRNNAITTINSPGSTDLYISSQFTNSVSPCNNLPRFAYSPSPLYCVNQLVNFNPLATDIDNDSLVFDLVDCQRGANNPVSYQTGFSGTNPLNTASGVSIDRQTGALSFTPSSIQVVIICIRVQEFRNGVKIGEVIRDFQFRIIPCSNISPVLTGMNGTSNFDTTICSGQNLCFFFNSYDANGDPLTITPINPITGSNITINGNGGTSPIGTFCWPTTTADSGSHIITVHVRDPNCPYVGQNTYTYEISVVPSSDSLDAGPDQSICAGDSAFLNATSPGAAGFNWLPTTGLSNPNINNPIAFPVVSSVYTVSATYANGCNLQDSLLVTVISPTNGLGNDTVLCHGNTLLLDVTDPSVVNYLWSTGSTASSININTSGFYWVDMNDGGCIHRDSIRVDFQQSPIINLGPDTTLCEGESFLLDANVGGDATYLWQDNSTNSTFTVSLPGTYSVTIDSGVCAYSDTINIFFDTPPSLSLGNDTTLCLGDQYILDASVLGATYLWQDNSTNSTLSVNLPGAYWVEVSAGACTVRDSINIHFDIPPLLDFGSDSSLCLGELLWLDVNVGGNATYRWQDGSTLSTYQVSSAGTYSVTIDSGACSVFDDITVTYDAPSNFNLGNDTTLCVGESLLLDVQQAGGATYLWQDSSTGFNFPVSQAGIYYVAVQSGVCLNSDTIIVNFDTLPLINLGPDTTLCTGDDLTLISYTLGGSYLWNDNSTAPTLMVSSSGIYSVEVWVGACRGGDSIEVNFDAPPLFELGPDTVLCEGEILVLDPDVQGGTYLWSDNSFTQTLTVSTGGTLWVEISLGACKGFDSIHVGFSAPPLIDLGPDTNLCKGQILLLDASWPGANYLWQDGSVDPIQIVDTSGTFSVTVEDGFCSGSDEIEISLLSLVEGVDLGEDTTLCSDETLVLDATHPEALQYVWNTGEETSEIEVKQTGVYWVEVSNECGQELDSISVDTKECECILYFPNAFTPNNDGLNDGFGPVFDCDLNDYLFTIYNRWGRIIFQSNNPLEKWRGVFESMPVPEGIYVWKVNYSYATDMNNFYGRAGSVTVIR